MRIQHNIAALNSARQLTGNNTAVSKNLEKLSSGFRINRAGDDAAGLAISEKMRGQIRGLDQATSNANDAINLIQTAEGGLNETHSILQRMRELAVQSANGTYQNEVDRENLNKEVDALKSEIDRISTSTQFNKIDLLNGSLDGSSKTGVVSATGLTLTPVAATKGTMTSAAASATAIGATNTYSVSLNDGTSFEFSVANTSGAAMDATATGQALYEQLTQSDLAKHFDITHTAGAFTFLAKEAGAGSVEVNGFTESTGTASKSLMAATGFTSGKDATTTVGGLKAVASTALADLNSTTATQATAIQALNNAVITTGGKEYLMVSGLDAATTQTLNKYMEESGRDITVLASTAGAPVAGEVNALISAINKDFGTNIAATGTDGSFSLSAEDAAKLNVGGNALTFQIGANGRADQQVSLNVADMSSKGLGVDVSSVATQDGANAAIDLIDNAINTVSGTRADLGALQNRLEYTVNNLSTTSENLTASESRIRDVDMAKEMMAYTKNNILVQASQAMLAQANQAPQGVLQLLQ